MRVLPFLVLLFLSISVIAQKKPLDHTVYDGWQNITERMLSNDGKHISFIVAQQEGDGNLFIKKTDGTTVASIARGYGASITDDSRFLICRIRPLFAETREARIKKKKPDEMPKDSMAIVELNTGNITKVARIKSFKVADEQAMVVAYLLEKNLPITAPKSDPDTTAKVKTKLNAAEPKTIEDPFEEGTDLVVRNLTTGELKIYPLVSEYYFNKKGNILLMETTKKTGDTKVKPSVVKLDITSGNAATIFVGFNDAKSYRMDETGIQLVFVAERDSSAKSLQKFYKLYHHKAQEDSAVLIVDKNTKGIPTNWMVSDNAAAIGFSKTGNRLFLGTTPILPVKDTLTPEFERVSVDIWNYKDDYLQTVQLRNLQQELNRAYLARYDFETKSVVQLASPAFRNIIQTNEGDGKIFYTTSDEGKRIAQQWQGAGYNDIYAINPENGESQLIAKDIKGNILASSTGKYLLVYNEIKRQYFAYNASTQKTALLAKDIKTPFYDINNDMPDDPDAYGVMGWMEGDSSVMVYDQFDIWQLDPNGVNASINLTKGLGRKQNLVLRNIKLDREERMIKPNQLLLISIFNKTDKGSGLKYHTMGESFNLPVGLRQTYPVRIANAIKAKNAMVLSYSTETFQRSADIKIVASLDTGSIAGRKEIAGGKSLYQPNPQQAMYNWGTAELVSWKSYTGKMAQGILYKPENFDSKKQYPMIAYFYERNSDELYGYRSPSPTPSSLNIPFYVSRGYLVFVPDIWYKIGYPGASAYDYIVSGTRAIVAKGFVDSTKLGLQGQSWGGYQIAHLITRTSLFAAAWAGAPVANMTSAYGGIRWGTGLNRQFQYEKTQSRIGGSLWDKTNLYIENSPLFHFPKVKTPVVIMANDADDAVPWYQGIEMFTALRRLGKPVWMLNYNNEAHNLLERKNRKDIQIRQQQFFDYLLKGDKPAKWIAEGVPAVMKGRDLGLGN